MRVALFTNNYLPFRGGVTTAVETLRQGLEGLRHSVRVFAPAPHPPMADPAWVWRYPSVPAPTYPGFTLAWPFSPRITGLARAFAPDIIHAQHPFLLGPAARRFARRCRRPLVFTYHTRYEKYAHYVPLPERFVAALAVKLSCRFAGSSDLVIAPSERIAVTLRARGVTAPMAVVPTGVPLDLFRPGDQDEARRRLAIPGETVLCLYVGRLDREKSVDLIIDAFGSIADAVSGVTLSLVGQGTHEPALRRRAERGPVPDRIRFHGGMNREALPVFYRAADLFLFASETETQGLVLAEAHASGLPAVAVRASGVDEVVRDGETGVLTKAESREFADAAIGLLLDRERRRGMSDAARTVAERDFSAARQVETMVGHYGRLLEQ
ncbi:MAG TPA: glycosyltransferase [Candidatus Methylomirabilis sp.]|nr:glycosyltransferase [Candidatus Methylomirabilis sp.]